MILLISKFHSPSLSHLQFQFAQVDRVKSNMDRCNYLVPNTNWMVEMPINGGQYHQAIASLWISHLVDNLPLTPVMLAHVDSAQLTNPRKITAQSGNISLSFSLRLSIFHSDILTFAPISTFNFHFDNFYFIIFGVNCHFLSSLNFRFVVWWFGTRWKSRTPISCRL